MQALAKRKTPIEEHFRKQNAYRRHAAASVPFILSSLRRNINHLVKGAFSCFKSGVGKLASGRR